MFKIVKRDDLNPTIVRISVEAPFVAKKAQPGQFVIVRANEDSERLPFTVAGEDPEKGTVTIIYQIVGAGTLELAQKKEGDYIADFVGPLGRPSELEGLKHVAIVGGGAGCAIAYPLAYKLHEIGAEVTSIAGFRNKDLVILERTSRIALPSSSRGAMTEPGVKRVSSRRDSKKKSFVVRKKAISSMKLSPSDLSSGGRTLLS